MSTVTGSHPAVDAQIPVRQHRARSAVARSSPNLRLILRPIRRIYESPPVRRRDIILANVLIWAVVAAWWFTTAVQPAHMPA